jgi:hypothetical protein
VFATATKKKYGCTEGEGYKVATRRKKLCGQRCEMRFAPMPSRAPIFPHFLYV